MVDIWGHSILLSWEAMKELNHSKTIQGFSPPLASSHQTEHQVREARLTSLKIKRIEFALQASILGHPLG